MNFAIRLRKQLFLGLLIGGLLLSCISLAAWWRLRSQENRDSSDYGSIVRSRNGSAQYGTDTGGTRALLDDREGTF